MIINPTEIKIKYLNDNLSIIPNIFDFTMNHTKHL